MFRAVFVHVIFDLNSCKNAILAQFLVLNGKVNTDCATGAVFLSTKHI